MLPGSENKHRILGFPSGSIPIIAGNALKNKQERILVGIGTT